MDILTPQQIQNWRKIICLQIEDVAKQRGLPEGTGAYAFIMPEQEVIEFWKNMKQVFEAPEPKPKSKPVYSKEPCKHINSFTGQNGRYCIDCEKYI